MPESGDICVTMQFDLSVLHVPKGVIIGSFQIK